MRKLNQVQLKNRNSANLRLVHRDMLGRFTKDWKILIKKIYKRDNYTCFKCKKRGSLKLHCHHIIPYSISKSDNPTNLITLCNRCHRKEDLKYLRYGVTNYVRIMLKIAKERTDEGRLK